jgi:D-arabinose 1-dehydrogenase-like Zn-dependent alcohol dehydrogenase
MLGGGITAFSPLLQYKAGPGKKVGIIGIGGLGHFDILGANALGCDKIVAISRTSAKREDALKMGATKFIATDEDSRLGRRRMLAPWILSSAPFLHRRCRYKNTLVYCV